MIERTTEFLSPENGRPARIGPFYVLQIETADAGYFAEPISCCHNGNVVGTLVHGCRVEDSFDACPLGKDAEAGFFEDACASLLPDPMIARALICKEVRAIAGYTFGVPVDSPDVVESCA